MLDGERRDGGVGCQGAGNLRLVHEATQNLPVALARLQHGGNGLGLAIADEIARSHHTQLQLLTGGNGRGLRVRVVFEAVRAGGRPVRESPEG